MLKKTLYKTSNTANKSAKYLHSNTQKGSSFFRKISCIMGKTAIIIPTAITGILLTFTLLDGIAGWTTWVAGIVGGLFILFSLIFSLVLNTTVNIATKIPTGLTSILVEITEYIKVKFLDMFVSKELAEEQKKKYLAKKYGKIIKDNLETNNVSTMDIGLTSIAEKKEDKIIISLKHDDDLVSNYEITYDDIDADLEAKLNQGILVL